MLSGVSRRVKSFYIYTPFFFSPFSETSPAHSSQRFLREVLIATLSLLVESQKVHPGLLKTGRNSGAGGLVFEVRPPVCRSLPRLDPAVSFLRFFRGFFWRSPPLLCASSDRKAVPRDMQKKSTFLGLKGSSTSSSAILSVPDLRPRHDPLHQVSVRALRRHFSFIFGLSEPLRFACLK